MRSKFSLLLAGILALFLCELAWAMDPGAPLRLYSSAEEGRSGRLIQADARYILYFDELDQSEHLLERKPGHSLEFHMDAGFEELAQADPTDSITTRDGRTLAVQLLEMTDRWVGYLLPGLPRRQLLPVEAVARVWYAGIEIPLVPARPPAAIPHPA